VKTFFKLLLSHKFSFSDLWCSKTTSRGRSFSPTYLVLRWKHFWSYRSRWLLCAWDKVPKDALSSIICELFAYFCGDNRRLIFDRCTFILFWGFFWIWELRNLVWFLIFWLELLELTVILRKYVGVVQLLWCVWLFDFTDSLVSLILFI